jgi:hypothetical protein
MLNTVWYTTFTNDNLDDLVNVKASNPTGFGSEEP